MTWREIRLVVFSVVGAIFLLVAPLVGGKGIDRVGIPLLLVFASLGALMVAIVAFDVAYHAWRGEGQACRRCGHLRQMTPFRLYGACPKCGEE